MSRVPTSIDHVTQSASPVMSNQRRKQ